VSSWRNRGALVSRFKNHSERKKKPKRRRREKGKEREDIQEIIIKETKVRRTLAFSTLLSREVTKQWSRVK